MYSGIGIDRLLVVDLALNLEAGDLNTGIVGLHELTHHLGHRFKMLVLPGFKVLYLSLESSNTRLIQPIMFRLVDPAGGFLAYRQIEVPFRVLGRFITQAYVLPEALSLGHELREQFTVKGDLKDLQRIIAVPEDQPTAPGACTHHLMLHLAVVELIRLRFGTESANLLPRLVGRTLELDRLASIVKTVQGGS